MAIGWDTSDALVLECIAWTAPADTDLERVIGTADYIDRFVFNHGELQRVIQGLLGAGLVEESNLRFRLDSAGQALRGAAPQGSTLSRITWLLSALRDRVPYKPATNWTLPADSFEAALAKYHADMRAAIDRTQPPHDP